MLKLVKQLFKRGQSGQALVIIAVGFIGLLGFVGIVTDISVLFIRYSTLSRAIDAAAISAAGQMRRVSVENPTPGVPAEDAAISVANLNLAARQFIELYGLDPTNVIVETCRAQQVARDANGNPLDGAGVPLYITSGSPPVTTRNPAADQAVIDRYEELCTEDELKLVRVTAQIEAPTIFLRLLGYPTVTLTEEAISQTAVLDVVLIIDVSESMLDETSVQDWGNIPNAPANQSNQAVYYLAPYVGIFHQAAWGNSADGFIEFTQQQLNTQLRVPTAAVAGGLNPLTVDSATATANGFGGTYFDVLSPYDATTNPIGDQSGDSRPVLAAFYRDSGGAYQWYTGPTAGNNNLVEPRAFCRVRAWPNSAQARARMTDDTATAYAGILSSYPGGIDAYYNQYGLTNRIHLGFVPQFNYFGCCNDPLGDLDANGNFSFTDLVCQPFGRARDAARDFLTRLDFLRGDRVGFVVFDRTAVTIDPDGNGQQSFMIEAENDIRDASNNLVRRGATETLDTIIGVRTDAGLDPATGTNRGYYSDTNSDGLWDAFWDYNTSRVADGVGSYMETRIADIFTHPTRGACELDKATLAPPFTDADLMPDGSPRTQSLIRDIINYPFSHASIPDDLRNYDVRAGCAGTNIGGALAQASNTLYNEGRTEGAVWIMVLLSDGAAGASNRVTRNGFQATRSNPYAIATNGSGAYDPVGFPLDPSGPASQYSYGSYGLCPFGTAANPSELITSNDFPYCSDIDPASRHFCGNAAALPDTRSLDSGASFNCYEFYDVDDYARDWADWIGLAELPGASVGAGSGRVSNQLVPTIFTIGFGLDFAYPTCETTGNDMFETQAEADCARGISPNDRVRRGEYLGEELLRYIADVGDNAQIDDDYQQSLQGDRIVNSVTDPNPANQQWGDAGPCEIDDGLTGNYAPYHPGQDCGNYWAASTGGNDLREVFDEIASRMFTRLSS